MRFKTGDPVLKGIHRDALLGTLHVTSNDCCLKATFEAPMGDFYVTDAEGLWSPEISKKQRVRLDRILVKHFLKKKFGKLSK